MPTRGLASGMLKTDEASAPRMRPQVQADVVRAVGKSTGELQDAIRLANTKTWPVCRDGPPNTVRMRLTTRG